MIYTCLDGTKWVPGGVLELEQTIDGNKRGQFILRLRTPLGIDPEEYYFNTEQQSMSFLKMVESVAGCVDGTMALSVQYIEWSLLDYDFVEIARGSVNSGGIF